MDQYTLIFAGSPLEITDGSSIFRYIVESGDLYLRQSLTATGFDGVEDTDWGNIEAYADLGGSIWRMGVRDLNWILDCTIDGTGFSGTEDVNWGNVEQHKLS